MEVITKHKLQVCLAYLCVRYGHDNMSVQFYDVLGGQCIVLHWTICILYYICWIMKRTQVGTESKKLPEMAYDIRNCRPTPASFCLLRSIPKPVDFCGIQTRIIRVEGEQGDQHHGPRLHAKCLLLTSNIMTNNAPS